MAQHIKLFENWLNEAESKPLFTLDLQKEMPEEFNRASRIQDEDDEDEYTDDITTTVKAYDASAETPKETPKTHIHPTFEKEANKIKLYFEDNEKGYGNYGPHGGGNEVTVYAGVKKLDEKSILDLFKELWKDQTLWEM